MPTAAFAAPNRTDQRAFLAVIAQEMGARDDASMLGLLLVQLAGVDALNFAVGYRMADQVLADVTTKLADAFGERARVLRVGSSRFAILLHGLKSEAHARLAASRVQRLGAELFAAGAPSDLSFAQGVALYPVDAASAEGLLQCAELALGTARASGTGLAVYRDEENAQAKELRRVGEEFGRAIENGRIEVYFQPQIDVATGGPVGAEALLRCRDQHGALLPPEAVVAVAEKTNRLGDLTSAVLNTALRHAAEWPLRARLSVNVSTHSLKDPDFPAVIDTALKIWDRRPGDFTIELTESAFIDEPEKSFAGMRALKALGVRVSIDDFGTGYSSLSYFTNIPAEELKVDKSFVLSMLASDAARRIVQAVVNLAHGFDLEVVAEGVEDEETFAALRRMGCDVAQGFWVGRPMPPAQFLGWLETAGQDF